MDRLGIAIDGRAGKRLTDLQGLFAPDVQSPHDFKRRFKENLKAIAKVYSLFDVAIEGDMLKLRYSKPSYSCNPGVLANC